MAFLSSSISTQDKSLQFDRPDFVVDLSTFEDLQRTNLIQNLGLVELDKVVDNDVWRPKQLWQKVDKLIDKFIHLEGYDHYMFLITRNWFFVCLFE